MKWFKHMTTLRRSQLFFEVKNQLGLEGQAILYLLFEVYHERLEGKEDPLSVKLLKAQWLDDLGLHRNALKKLLNVLEIGRATNEITALEEGDYLEVEIPHALEIADDYFRRVRTSSGQRSPRIEEKRSEEIKPDKSREEFASKDFSFNEHSKRGTEYAGKIIEMLSSKKAMP